ncbi:MAG: UvrD-helicase domain-containing protein [Bacteroidaceae bacterium]|nr:UvrD-helicase domain-containing protein [Bacteroidaceae bacterium]
MNPKFIVYRASAGSGKTFTLAAEYIALLLRQPNGNEFQHILAVTFTNMATAEMKGRIIAYLYSLAHNLPGLRDFKEKLQTILQNEGITLSDETIQQRAANSLSFILHDYTHFRVETIDSFFQSVVRNLAHELGLNSNFQVELNAKALIDRAVDRIIENLRDDQPDSVKQTITALLESKMNEGKSWNVTAVVKSFAKCIYDEAFQMRTEDEQALLRSKEDIRRFVADIVKIREQAAQQLLSQVNAVKSAIDAQELNFQRISYANRYMSFLTKIEQFRMTDKEMSATVYTTLYEDATNLLRSADRKKPDLVEQADQTSALLRQLYDDYKRIQLDVTTVQLTLRHINELSLLGHIEDASEALCEEHNQFSLNKTPVLLQKLVGSNDSPFVFEKAGTQFRHVMIDEFQDTSLMQWLNFRVLLLDNLSAGGMDLLVGDVKQSIYRWRNGDWKILHHITQTPGLPALPKVEPLKHNFRSCKNVIDFNNSFFRFAAETLDADLDTNQIQAIYDDVEQLSPKTEQTGFVRLQLHNASGTDADYKRQMAEDMILQIKNVLSLGVSPESIAILVRFHSDGTDLIRLFEELHSGITLVSDEAFLLNASVAVQMLVNALRLLANPSTVDPIAMRYLCLHFLLDVQHKSFETSSDSDTSNPGQILPEAFLAHLKELSELPLYVLCERLVRIFSLSEIPGQDVYIMTFLDVLQHHLHTSQTDIKSFLKAWDESLYLTPIPSGRISGVRIITIHKSKGLQFHTVLIPSTHWKIESSRNDDRLWCLAEDARFNSIGKLPIDLNASMAHSHFRTMYAEEQFQCRVDAINLLYVAFTRAERNLMVWGTTSADEKNGFKLSSISLSGDLLYAYICQNADPLIETPDFPLEYVKGDLLGPVAEKQHDSGRMDTAGLPLHVPVVSYSPNLDFQQSNLSQQFLRDLASEADEAQTYLDIGKIMHYVLSKINMIDEVKTVLQQCKVDGLVQDDRIMDLLLQRLNKGFANPLVSSWFSPDVQSLNECSIIGHAESNPSNVTHRPDRVILSDNAITVVDYKFARPVTDHHQQVQGYMELLHKMYPNMQVNGYLWYVYSNTITPVQPK